MSVHSVGRVRRTDGQTHTQTMSKLLHPSRQLRGGYKLFKDGKDTEEIIMLDVDKCGVPVCNDWCHDRLLFEIHQHWHELVYHRHINITAVITTYQHLKYM